MERFKKFTSAYFRIGVIVVLAVGVVCIWYTIFYLESHQNLVVTFFDVGQGDSAFIETPNGNQVLIDGGPSDAVLSKLGRILPFWDRSIDMLVLTHAHADHVGGLIDVLARYRVGRVVESGEAYGTPDYQEWHTRIAKKQIPVVIAYRGQSIDLGGGVILRVLSPFENYEGVSVKNVHDGNVSTKLEYGSTSMLFTGDAEKLIEYRLVSEDQGELQSDILKVGHHGSKTSSTEAFLRAVQPDFAIISSGRKNRYGHPHQDVLDRLAAFGVSILRTDIDGDIQIESDGETLVIDGAR